MQLKPYRHWLGLALITLLFVVVYHPITETRASIEYGAIPKEYLSDCDIFEFPNVRGPLKAWFLCFSQNILGDIKLMPFIFSTALIPMTFLLARKITNNDNLSLLGSSLLLGSSIIGYLGTTPALSSDWAFFLVASMYMVYKRPELAGVFFFLSVASKGLPLLILPFLVYFAYRTESKKAMTSYAISGIIITMMWAMGATYLIQEDGLRWNIDNYPAALDDMWFVFRSDILQYVMVPASIIICVISKHKMAKPLLYLNVWFYSLVFLLPVFSMYQMFDYRMIPVIIFSCLGISLVKNVKSKVSQEALEPHADIKHNK